MIHENGDPCMVVVPLLRYRVCEYLRYCVCEYLRYRVCEYLLMSCACTMARNPVVKQTLLQRI